MVATARGVLRVGGVRDRRRSLPRGPELLSLAVLLLAALLIATALSYSALAPRGGPLPVPGAGALDAPCPTMASCNGDRRISPGSPAAAQ